MEAALNTLVHHLFKKNSIRELELSEIEDFVNRYPYANAGRVVLAAKKYYLHPEFHDEVHTAALYLKNPLWLEQLLNESTDKSSPSTSITEETIAVSEQESIETVPAFSPILEEKADEALVAEVAAEPDARIKIAGTIVIEESVETVPENQSEPSPISATTQAPTPKEAEKVEEAPVVTIHKLPTISAQAPENVVSLIEPYHTIDYFASQGIKVKLEDLDKDKFGRQLKSFTEWLRTMKKVPKVAENAADEAVVVKQAEDSIENTDVETEAMAEVWLKQGKTARAKAIYRKLSLLNPDKSAYFAAKIDQIKD